MTDEDNKIDAIHSYIQELSKDCIYDVSLNKYKYNKIVSYYIQGEMWNEYTEKIKMVILNRNINSDDNDNEQKYEIVTIDKDDLGEYLESTHVHGKIEEMSEIKNVINGYLDRIRKHMGYLMRSYIKKSLCI